MRRFAGLGIAVTTILFLGAASCAAQTPSCPGDGEHAAILSETGEHCFAVEIADTPSEHQRGLMFVRHLDADRGMLFLFDYVAEKSFWMKNTYVSLDIIFIGADGRIVNIAPRTEPLSEQTIPSAGPVAAVLEINGGLAAKLGVKAGDRVRHPALGEDGAQAARRPE